MFRVTGSLPFRARCYATQAASSKVYSSTLLLPKTTFPLKHKKPAEGEAIYRQRTTEELYRKQHRPDFVLHDGPPYANGNLHMGHALNRVLKDIINRYKLSRGYRIHYVPGWDCHGLPIEQKALKQIGTSHLALDPSQVRDIARKTALDAIEVQKDEMKALGVMADWNDIYRTLDPQFEIRQLRLFQQLVENGFISYRRRPVYYSPSSRTALAESELKYNDSHESRSAYVSFDVDKTTISESLRKYLETAGAANAKLVIWTTTPWTLPSNMAIAVHSDLQYVMMMKGGHAFITAADRMDVLGDGQIIGQFPGRDLLGAKYTGLFTSGSVIHSRYVTADAGTGLVHTAPAHGHEDYEVMGPVDLLCPVDDAGCFVGAHSALDGKEVLGDGTDKVIDLLQQHGSLVGEERIVHRYPYDWKTKKPVIIRATPQWFADLTTIKPMAVTAMDSVAFHPPQSRNRLESFVQGRSEWCISRQRSWGVPIPAMFSDNQPIMSPEVFEHVIQVLEQHGTDYWWTGPEEAFQLPGHRRMVRGRDTLDVWFDSGSSWTLLPERRADLYLEGSDQHRGWFQSSLLTHVGANLEAKAPYGSLLTHGFITDEKGQKMSKSDGNGISPTDMIAKHGADTLRVWAASVDFTRDVSVGPSAIQHAAEILRKWRNTTRFLLANISGAGDIQLSLIDRYMLSELSRLERESVEHYDSFAFNRVVASLHEFMSHMSSVYFDTVKDLLYCERRDDPRRLGAVHVLRVALKVSMRIIAPIAPHLAEELHTHAGNDSSVFLSDWKASNAEDVRLDQLLRIRSAILSMMESTEAKSLGDLDVAVETDHEGKWQLMTQLTSDSDVCQVLGVATVRQPADLSSEWRQDCDVGGTKVSIAKARLHKCPRCRRSASLVRDECCTRCAGML